MIGRILLTLAVIAIAYVFVRQRRLAEEAENKPVPVKKDKLRDELSQDLRMAAYMFMVLMVGIGGAVYYFRWQDEHTILTINLHRENQAQPVSYQVYKYQLQERSFTTIDGTHVTVAGSERMEVLSLEQ